MKMTNYFFALLTICIFSNTLMAQESDHELITPGKLEAVSADFCIECNRKQSLDDLDLVTGKIEAAMYGTMEAKLSDDLRLLKKITTEGDRIGMEMDDSKGLVKLFGSTIDIIESNTQEMKLILKNAEGLSGKSLDQAFNKINSLSNENQKLGRDALNLASEITE